MSGIVLVGAPGAGVTSVGQQLAALAQLPFVDLALSTAQSLGVAPHTALVSVPEPEYRRAETEQALSALAQLSYRPGVLALGSGCLHEEAVQESLRQVKAESTTVVMLTAPLRTLATRNGLDAPRSIAFGTVRHEFGLMLKTREELCRSVADSMVDTEQTTATQCAAAILDSLSSAL